MKRIRRYIREGEKPLHAEAQHHQDDLHACTVSGDEKELFGGTRLLRLGGHFPGSAVLHWSNGAAGKGVLCTGVV